MSDTTITTGEVPDSKTGRPRYILKLLPYFLAPAFLFLCIEVGFLNLVRPGAEPLKPTPEQQAKDPYFLRYGFRNHIWSQTFGYQTVLQTSGGNNFDVLFIGTSRTIAAVDEKLFSQLATEKSGHPVYAVNMAGGGNKLVHHYFGLRRLYEDDPSRLKNMTLMVEAPDELPDYMPWTDDWVFPDHKHVFLPNMRWTDLGALWRSDTPLNSKIHITLNLFMYDWRTFERRYVIRHETIRIGTEWIEQRITNITGREKPIEKGIDDIIMRGGIRADPDIVRRNEFFFNQYYESNREEIERPWRDWDNTVLDSIIDLVVANGGRVVFFHVPQYSIYNRIYFDVPAREQDRVALRQYRAERHIDYLVPDFTYEDDSFPDRFHLGIPQSEKFTRALVEEFGNDK